MNSTKLSPCLFCGGAVTLEELYDNAGQHDDDDEMLIICDGPCQYDFFGTLGGNIVELWNSRAKVEEEADK